MAKQQSFADKAKKIKKDAHVNVKVIKAIKTTKGSFKFSEKFVKLDDINKIAAIK